MFHSKIIAIGSVGMIPGSVMYVYIGSLAGDIASLEIPQEMSFQAQIAQWIIKILGFLATVAVTVYTAQIAQRSLNQSIRSR
ncbi:hypothetical protein HC928_19945 [bacterium]|nr:hypothetical protein [bacterium]